MEEQVKTSYGFKVLDERKDTTGNILQAIIEDVFETNVMDSKRLRQNVDYTSLHENIREYSSN